MTAAEMSGFQDVDSSADALRYLAMLDRLDQLSFFQSLRAETIRRMNLRPADAALDLGCGTGLVTRELARIVGPCGHAVGVDLSAVMLHIARQRAGIPPPPQLRFLQADLRKLPFPPDSFSALRAERVFMYLDDPAAALAEVLPVLKPGAPILCFDPDMEGWMIDAADHATTRAILNFWSDEIPSPWIGRRWFRIARSLQLQNIEILPYTLILHDWPLVRDGFMLGPTAQRAADAGAASPRAVEYWIEDLNQRHADGSFFFATTNLLLSARKTS
jgi:ubiquinone/menaquinone biosynthesis C-methylase UbiE